jgi:DNA-binding XRE family transcriptional regulator
VARILRSRTFWVIAVHGRHASFGRWVISCRGRMGSGGLPSLQNSGGPSELESGRLGPFHPSFSQWGAVLVCRSSSLPSRRFSPVVSRPSRLDRAGLPRACPCHFNLAVCDYLGQRYGHDGPVSRRRQRVDRWLDRIGAEEFLTCLWAVHLGDVTGASAPIVWLETRCRLSVAYDSRVSTSLTPDRARVSFTPVPEASSFYVEVGRRVRLHREATRLSQEQLAKHLRLTRSSVANLEAGQQRISAETLVAVSQVLGVDLAELLPSRAPTADVQSMIPPGLPRKIRRWITDTVAKAPAEAVGTST